MVSRDFVARLAASRAVFAVPIPQFIETLYFFSITPRNFVAFSFAVEDEIIIKLSPPIKNVSEFCAKKNSDISEYNLNINEEISYGYFLADIDVEPSISMCMMFTACSDFPFTKPNMLSSLFKKVFDFLALSA